MCTMEIDGVTYAVEMKVVRLSKEQSDAQLQSYKSLTNLGPIAYKYNISKQWSDWVVRREKILRRLGVK